MPYRLKEDPCSFFLNIFRWKFGNNWNVVMNYLLLNTKTCHQKVCGISSAIFFDEIYDRTKDDSNNVLTV